jgi:hypothetical protein
MPKKKDPVYSGDMLTLRQQLLALAAHWRSQGEYWSGTPADARSQHCADDLLKVIGCTDEHRVALDQKAHDILKPFGIYNCEPSDRNEQWVSYFKFHKKELKWIVKDAEDELDKKGGYKKEPTNRPRDIIIGEKIMWGYEYGYTAGRVASAKGAKKTYKRSK